MDLARFAFVTNKYIHTELSPAYILAPIVNRGEIVNMYAGLYLTNPCHCFDVLPL